MQKFSHNKQKQQEMERRKEEEEKVTKASELIV